MLPITVRLECEHAVHHPGALPSLRPEREKAHQGHSLLQSVCAESNGVVTSCCSCKQSQVVVPHHRLLRNGPAPNRRPRSTAGRSPAPPPGSCARSRSTGTPTAPRRRPAARSPPPCSRPPAGARMAQRAPSTHDGSGRGNERGKLTNTRSACLGDGARVDPVERAAEDLAVAEAEAELLLGRLLRQVARGDRPHRAAQPPRRLVPPRRCSHQLTEANEIQNNPAGANPPKRRRREKRKQTQARRGRANRTGFLGPA